MSGRRSGRDGSIAGILVSNWLLSNFRPTLNAQFDTFEKPFDALELGYEHGEPAGMVNGKPTWWQIGKMPSASIAPSTKKKEDAATRIHV